MQEIVLNAFQFWSACLIVQVSLHYGPFCLHQTGTRKTSFVGFGGDCETVDDGLDSELSCVMSNGKS